MFQEECAQKFGSCDGVDLLLLLKSLDELEEWNLFHVFGLEFSLFWEERIPRIKVLPW